MDIGMSDFKFMDGKRVGVLMDTEPEIMLTEWENKNGIHTEHVNVNNDNDVEKKLANHEIDAFVSLEESIWSEQGISSVTTIGKLGIYFAINKERSDIKIRNILHLIIIRVLQVEKNPGWKNMVTSGWDF